MVRNNEPVQVQTSFDPSKSAYYSQKPSTSNNSTRNSASNNRNNYSFPCSNGPNKNIYEKVTGSKENLKDKKMEQVEQSYSTFSSNNDASSSIKGIGLKNESDSIINKTTTPMSQAEPSTGESQNTENNADSSIFPLSKKKVRFEPGSNDENTPLINNKATRRPAPISTAIGPPVPPRNNESILPFIRSKLPLWVWILFAILFFLGNIIILAVLFTDNIKSQGIIEQLLSNIDYNQIGNDLKYFKKINTNSSDISYINYFNKGNYKLKENKPTGASYIKEQINKFSQFDIETQHFAVPTWHLISNPIMSIYIEEDVSLEHEKDFVGNKHYHRHMHVLPVTPKSCSLYHSELRHRAALLPFPSGKTAGIGVPTTCSEWDLVYSAQQAGARAVIFYQVESEKLPEFDMFQHPKLLPVGWRPGGAMINIPVIIVSRLVGEILRSSHRYKVDIITNTEFQVENSHNIVAKLSHKNLINNDKPPFILGSHWDFDPITSLKKTSEYPVTGAVGLLAIARALEASKVIPMDRPIHLVWFGDRFPLTLGVKAFIDDLWLNTFHNRMAYLYFDLGDLNGDLPQIQNSSDVPEHLRPISRKTQTSIERIITFEYDQFRRSDPVEKIPTYELNSVIGEPSKHFNQFGIPTSGLSSIHSSKNHLSQEENVNQLTEVTLITLGTLNKLSNEN